VARQRRNQRLADREPLAFDARMKPFVSPRVVFAAVALGLAAVNAPAHPAAEQMAAAARQFLDSLTPAQRAKATYELKSDARFEWHFIPTEMVTFGRKGVPFTELKEEQRRLGLALLRTGLSEAGYTKATNIMSLEAVLKEIERNARVDRNPLLYFISIYGQPDPQGTWAWRFEGHHLSLNFTIAAGKAFASGPSFMGSNPAEVREGPRRGLRVLSREEDLGRMLIKSLNAAQQAEAIFDKVAPRDILTAANRKATPQKPDGIAFGKLSAEQATLLQRLVEEYVRRARNEVAEADLAKIAKAGWDKVHFAWAGGLERGQGHYYRVQGPTFLLEYDNTQNDANHIHAVWRDFEGDFGEDLLRRHLAEAHGVR
jgi:enamine deaminase RidA (YjgF/YER057c/UK114 family)